MDVSDEGEEQFGQQENDDLEQLEKEFIESALSEPSLVFFYVPLPWPIGLPPVARYTLERDEQIPWGNDVDWPGFLGVRDPVQNFVLVSLHRHEHVAEFDDRLFGYAKDLADEMASIDSAATHNAKKSDDKNWNFGAIPLPSSTTPAAIVELVTPILEDTDSHLDPVSLAFNRCIEELNLVETSYFMTSQDLRVRLTTRPTCFPAVPITLRRVTSGEVMHTGIYMVNLGVHLLPYDVDDLSLDKAQEMAVRISLAKRGQPLLTYVERTFNAQRALRLDGDFATSVIWCHTAGEIFLDTILSMMAWEEINFQSGSQTMLSDVVSWFSHKSSLTGRIERHYHARLFGGWTPAVAGHPLHRWINEVSRLRNRVIHAGYRPSESEAYQALEILGIVENYVKDLLCHHRNRVRYVRTGFMLLGEPGLTKRNAFSKGTKRLIESAEVDWHRSFVDFREQVDKALAR